MNYEFPVSFRERHPELLSQSHHDKIRIIDENLALLRDIFAMKQQLREQLKRNKQLEASTGIYLEPRAGYKNLEAASEPEERIRKYYETQAERLNVQLDTLLNEQQRLKQWLYASYAKKPIYGSSATSGSVSSRK